VNDVVLDGLIPADQCARRVAADVIAQARDRGVGAGAVGRGGQGDRVVVVGADRRACRHCQDARRRPRCGYGGPGVARRGEQVERGGVLRAEMLGEQLRAGDAAGMALHGGHRVVVGVQGGEPGLGNGNYDFVHVIPG